MSKRNKLILISAVVLITIAVAFVFIHRVHLDKIEQHEKKTEENSQYKGELSENTTWEIKGDTLIISGTGDMYDLDYHQVPWFESREDITSVVVKEGITNIDFDSKYLENVTSISVPASVTDIAFTAIDNYKLKAINVSSDNDKYASIDGVLFNKDKTTLIRLPRGISGTYTIPAGVERIERRAAHGCNLTDIIITDSVTEIGDYAFSGLNNLINITIPDSVVTIGESEFSSCFKLEKVLIGKGVRNIGSDFLISSYALTDIYYTGSKEQWDKIEIDEENEYLFNKNIIYDYIPSDR